MKIQYRKKFWTSLCGKIICHLKADADMMDVAELADNTSMFKQSDFYTMHLQITDYSEVSDYLSFSSTDDCPGDYAFHQNYVQIILGKVSEWKLVTLEISTNIVSFLFFKFNQDGKIVDNEWVRLDSLPQNARLRIEVEEVPDGEVNAYEIFRSDDGTTFIVDEFVSQTKQRTCQIEDEGYELVTEYL